MCFIRTITGPKSLTKIFLVSIKASEILQCERVISMILMQYKERNWYLEVSKNNWS